MRNIPLSVLLSFPKPDYDNPVTKGNSATIIFGIFTGLVVITVSLRAYARVVIQKWFGWDDIFIVLALLSTIVLNCLVILAMSEYGWDRHVWDIKLNLIQPSEIMGFISKIMFVVSTTFTRFSLLSFYYRLVQDTSKKHVQYALHASTCYISALFITSMFLAIFSCSPVKAYWTFPPMEDQKCLNDGDTAFFIGILNCLADLLLTILPIPLIITLNMPLRLRLSVLGLLCLGFIVTIAGIIRTLFSWQVRVGWDETWESYPLWIAAGIEVNIGLMCACAPALRLFVMNAFRNTVSSIGRTFNTGMRSEKHAPTGNGSVALIGHTWQAPLFTHSEELDSDFEIEMGKLDGSDCDNSIKQVGNAISSV